MSVYVPKPAFCCNLCLDECASNDPVKNSTVITVGIGGCRVAKEPCVIKTTLGSCIGVTLFDKINKIGGLIHIMLPDSSKSKGRITKFADTGIPNLINCMINEHYSQRSALSAKIFGGAKMFNVFSKALDIGTNNTNAVLNVLKQQGIKVEGGKTGGTQGTQIIFRVSDGKILFKTIGGIEEIY